MSRAELLRLAAEVDFPPLVYCGRPLSPSQWHASAFPHLIDRLRLARELEAIAEARAHEAGR
jgi:hypothetical protein